MDRRLAQSDYTTSGIETKAALDMRRRKVNDEMCLAVIEKRLSVDVAAEIAGVTAGSVYRRVADYRQRHPEYAKETPPPRKRKRPMTNITNAREMQLRLDINKLERRVEAMEELLNKVLV